MSAFNYLNVINCIKPVLIKSCYYVFCCLMSYKKKCFYYLKNNVGSVNIEFLRFQLKQWHFIWVIIANKCGGQNQNWITFFFQGFKVDIHSQYFSQKAKSRCVRLDEGSGIDIRND